MNPTSSPARRSRLLGKIALWSIGFVFIASISVANARDIFRTPEEAAEALVNAARNDWPNGVAALLGPGGSQIVSSGDKVADEDIRATFLAAYDAKHEVVKRDDNSAVLIIGTEDFPLPIPLVRKKVGWEFDAIAGKREILYRRIGRNELDTIQTALAYVDAQNEYAEKDRTGAGFSTYAQRFVSRPGKTDGLYWPESQGGEASPLGDLFAQATGEGYSLGGGSKPYHGYYFRILKRQGPSAPGGAMDYLVRGKLIGGFGLVAYPAEYGNSGVMTFVVNHTGEVFQKDLGARTARRAARITSFNPDHTWKKVVDTALNQ